MYIISTLSFILNPSTKDAGFHEKYSYQDNCQHSTVVKVKRYVHKAVARRTHISIYHKFLTSSKFWFPKILNRMGGKVEEYCQAFQARFSRPCTKQNRHYSKKVRGIVYTRKKFWGKVDRINDAQNWQPLVAPTTSNSRLS